MNELLVSALAALAGATIGTMSSALTAWMAQRSLARARWLEEDAVRRQELYREFIEEASKSYIDALQHGTPDMPALVGLHTKISRMRVLSSPKVIGTAERIAQTILDLYLEPDKSFLDLRNMAKGGAINLLHDFSDACWAEFASPVGAR